MVVLRALLLVGVPLLAAGGHAQQHGAEQDAAHRAGYASLADLVNDLPRDSLEAALHQNLSPKYRDGVFPGTHDAIEAVHHDDPALASRLVNIAQQDAILRDHLRARAAGNNSTADVTTSTSTILTSASGASTLVQSTFTSSSSTTSSPATTSAEPTTSTTLTTSSTSALATQTGVLVPVIATSTNLAGSVTTETSTALVSEAPTSVSVAVTTTNNLGETVTTSTLVPANVQSTINADGSTGLVTSLLSTVAVAPGGSVITSAPSSFTTTAGSGQTVVLHSPTVNGVYTTTDNSGRTVTVTYTPSALHVSQLSLRTTTLPNGVMSTVTSVVVVGATGAAGAGSSSPSGAGDAHLQSRASITAPSVTGLMAEMAIVLVWMLGTIGFLL